ncbi:MAG: sugar phosphate isomerase/epimerase [Negativicutes bacterium]|nr:sugar phosphate isomerase/epimerase [Negativicutes bacterium]
MRLIISAVTWEPFLLSGMCQLELVPLADKYGCAGIEFRPYWRSALEELPEIREFLAEYGLVSTYACRECLLASSEEETKVFLTAMKASILLAEKLGAGIMRISVASGPFNRDFISAGWWRQAVREIITAAAGRGIVLGLGNSPDPIGGNPVLIMDILALFASPHLKATYNTGNWAAAGWDPQRALDILAGQVGYVQIKDVTAANVPVHPGSGSVAILDLIDRLTREGYEGLYALEFPGGQSPAATVKASLKYLRRE